MENIINFRFTAAPKVQKVARYNICIGAAVQESDFETTTIHATCVRKWVPYEMRLASERGWTTGNKIDAIKALRSINPLLSLKDAKEMVEFMMEKSMSWETVSHY